MYFLGIDIGSSFLKSSVLNLSERKIEASGSLPTPPFAELPPARREIPIHALTDAVRQLIHQAAAAYPLEGVVFSVQMHGFMLFEPNGKPVTDYISWQDLRAAVPGEDGRSLMDRLREDLPDALLREDGIRLRPNHSLLPLCHYVREQSPAGPLELAMIGDGVTRLLTGRRVAVHPTQAASTGLYSLEQGDWNRTLIARLGLEQVDFPPVSESAEPVAVYDGPAGKVPIYLALGDHQAAVLGIGAEDGDLFINIGTGGQIGYVNRGISLGDYETRPFFLGRTIRAVTQLPSGRSLNVLLDFVMDVGRRLFDAQPTQKEVWSRIGALTVGQVPEGGLQADLSFFDAGGGSLQGINGENFTARNLFVSAYDAMAAAYRAAARRVLSAADGMPAGVVCTGGVVRRNPLLLERISHHFSIPCRLAPYSDDTMVGLLRYALWCRTGKPLFGEPFALSGSAPDREG